MSDRRNGKEPGSDLRASVAKELATPRMAKSARIAQLNQDTTRVSLPPSVIMPGTVNKIILPSYANRPEHVQIAVDGADPEYRDLRIESTLIDEHGDDVSLKIGAPVEVIVTAHPRN